MDIDIIRYNSQNDFTDGLLFIDGLFKCFTLEDEERTEKIFGETRIPNGSYKISLRKKGGFHNRYLKKFGPTFHKGMLQVEDVPNFSNILIHIGNTDDDTAGCLLVGMTQNADDKGFVGGSTIAYKKIYPEILSALERGEYVHINYKDIDLF